MSMTRLAATVEINAPLDSAWTYASHWRYWDEWWDSASGLRPTTELTRCGSRYVYRAWTAGLQLNLYWEGRGKGSPGELRAPAGRRRAVRCRPGPATSRPYHMRVPRAHVKPRGRGLLERP